MNRSEKISPAGSAAVWWARLGELLGDERARVVRQPSRGEFLRRWEEIAEKERGLDERLLIGVVGGTGVGKSTLINALAGEEISKASDRRPTTDRVVVYRHAEARLPSTFPRRDLAEPERTHANLALEKQILFDFPDFDSVQVDHARILEQCLPHLDITFVVTDAMKYGDRAFYRELGAFPQDPQNLYLLFNKVDALRERYARVEDVVADIIDDLRGKFRRHLGWEPPASRVFAVSALEALAARLARAGSAAGGESPARPGDSPGNLGRVFAVLDAFGAAKKRRAAKEINLHYQKWVLARDIRERCLRPLAADLAERDQHRIDTGTAEVSALLDATPPEVLGPSERLALRNLAVTRLRHQLGFPMDSLFTLASELRFRRRRPPSGARPAIGSRLRTHYRPALDSLHAFAESYRLERAEARGESEPSSALLTRGAAAREERAAGAVESEVDPDALLNREIESRTSSFLRFRRLRNHLLPAGAVALFLWSLVHPVVLQVIRGFEAEEGVRWGSLLGAAFSSIVQGLNPFSCLGLLFLVLCLYGLGALTLWSRLTHVVEDAVTVVEAAGRERVAAAIRRQREEFEAQLRAWELERAEWAVTLEEGLRDAPEAAEAQLSGSA